MNALVDKFPALQPLRQEHLEDQYGEMLPHVLLADVERWVEKQISNTSGIPHPDVRGVLEYLEEGFKSDQGEVNELIAVSFLEHLPRPPDPASEIRSYLGPCLQKHLHEYGL